MRQALEQDRQIASERAKLGAINNMTQTHNKSENILKNLQRTCRNIAGQNKRHKWLVANINRYSHMLPSCTKTTFPLSFRPSLLTALAESAKSILRRPMALMMAMMDWMVLL